MRDKHKQFVKEGIGLAVGFTPVGNTISLFKFVKKWGKEAINHVNNRN
jgi:hypothetical protein